MTKNGRIVEIIPRDFTQTDLPDGCRWDTLDMHNPNQLRELYLLLRGHFVEDSFSQLRFDYSEKFLKWALLVPGYIKQNMI